MELSESVDSGNHFSGCALSRWCFFLFLLDCCHENRFQWRGFIQKYGAPNIGLCSFVELATQFAGSLELLNSWLYIRSDPISWPLKLAAFEIAALCLWLVFFGVIKNCHPLEDRRGVVKSH